MADKIQPVSKPVSKNKGLTSPSSYSTLTTPEPNYGKYWSGETTGENARGQDGPIMGRKSSK